MFGWTIFFKVTETTLLYNCFISKMSRAITFFVNKKYEDTRKLGNNVFALHSPKQIM